MNLHDTTRLCVKVWRVNAKGSQRGNRFKDASIKRIKAVLCGLSRRRFKGGCSSNEEVSPSVRNWENETASRCQLIELYSSDLTLNEPENIKYKELGDWDLLMPCVLGIKCAQKTSFPAASDSSLTQLPLCPQPTLKSCACEVPRKKSRWYLHSYTDNIDIVPVNK